jgi:uncharacterized membrane protein
MLVATLALLGGLLAFYLLLTHLGLSTLVCPLGGCEVVQASSYARFLGIPVAAFGLAYFALVVVAAAWSLSSDRILGLPAQPLLVGMTLVGVLPFLPLTYIELFVLRAVCMWCVISSFCMLGAFLAALWGRKASQG